MVVFFLMISLMSCLNELGMDFIGQMCFEFRFGFLDDVCVLLDGCFSKGCVCVCVLVWNVAQHRWMGIGFLLWSVFIVFYPFFSCIL